MAGLSRRADFHVVFAGYRPVFKHARVGEVTGRQAKPGLAHESIGLGTNTPVTPDTVNPVSSRAPAYPAFGGVHLSSIEPQARIFCAAAWLPSHARDDSSPP